MAFQFGMPGLPEILIMLLCFGFLGGMIALIVVLASKAGRSSNPQPENRIPCPECGEQIMPEAVKCRFCGARFDTAPPG